MKVLLSHLPIPRCNFVHVHADRLIHRAATAVNKGRDAIVSRVAGRGRRDRPIPRCHLRTRGSNSGERLRRTDGMPKTVAWKIGNDLPRGRELVPKREVNTQRRSHVQGRQTGRRAAVYCPDPDVAGRIVAMVMHLNMHHGLGGTDLAVVLQFIEDDSRDWSGALRIRLKIRRYGGGSWLLGIDLDIRT